MRRFATFQKIQSSALLVGSGCGAFLIGNSINSGMKNSTDNETQFYRKKDETSSKEWLTEICWDYKNTLWTNIVDKVAGKEVRHEGRGRTGQTLDE